MTIANELQEKIKEDLIRHEGYVTEIYLDSEFLPTFGIGHLVTETDPEHSWPVGTPVTDDRILDVFHIDCGEAVKDAECVVDNLSSPPYVLTSSTFTRLIYIYFFLAYHPPPDDDDDDETINMVTIIDYLQQII